MFKKYILWNNTFLKNNIRLKVVTNKKKHNISTKIIKWIPQITIKNKKWKKKTLKTYQNSYYNITDIVLLIFSFNSVNKWKYSF
jgi:hypothetical protein